MIQLVDKNGALALGQKMMKGDDGGYYIPSVDENGNLTWIPSEEDMAAIEGANIKGPRGDTGVYIGSEPPVDEDIAVWVNPEGEATAELATKSYVDEAIKDVDVDLTGYATEQYVDDAIAAVELLPGPAGKDGQDGAPGKDGEPGQDGKDYVLTEEDKQEIASMVDVSGSDVDLSDYYTKEEIDGLLANLPVGDIPSGEGVKF